LQELWRVPQEQHNICDQFGMHNFRVSTYQQQLQLTEANMFSDSFAIPFIYHDCIADTYTAYPVQMHMKHADTTIDSQP
jgi:hypothetical protein